MKILIFIITVACLQSWGTGYSQTLHLNLKNARMEKVFQLIREQSRYRFIYTKEEIETTRPVTVLFHDATIEEVMNTVLAGQSLDWMLDGIHVIVKKKTDTKTEDLPVPPLDIRGRVIGHDGAPLAGATVLIKGTNRRTVTDENGEFFFTELPAGSILIIQSLEHHTKEFTVVDEKPFTIHLVAVVGELQELRINTGYEEVSKERATGSFEKVSNDLFNRSVTTHVIERLEAIVPGLVFNKKIGTNNTTNINIRGISTFRSDQQPLIVIDNFPYEGNINNINPNDVESITILKDASASSIWGARAGNGVIVITTKKARFNQKTKLTINNNLTIVDEPRLNYIPRFSSADYIELEKFLFGRGYYNSTLNSPSYPVVSPVIEILHQRRSGLISAQDSALQIAQLLGNNIFDDYKKYLYRRAINAQHSLNLSGGNNSASYLFSAGFDKNLAILIGDDYTRFSLRSLNHLRPVKNLEITMGLNFTSTSADNNSLGEEIRLSGGKELYPYAKLAGINGEPLALPKDYRMEFLDTAGQGKILDWHYRPLDELHHSDKTRKSTDWLANLGLRWTLKPWINLDIKYQYEKNFDYTRNYRSLKMYETRTLINYYTPRGGTTVQSKIPLGGILDQYDTELSSQAIRGQVNINRRINEKHEFSALAGGEMREINISSETSRIYGYDDRVIRFASVSYNIQYPTYFGSNSALTDLYSLTKKNDRFVSFYGNASYTFLRKYTATISGRRDASNLFGTNTNNKWKPLWSTGVSWDLLKDFTLNKNWFQQLRIRASYGHSGNVNNSIPALLTLVSGNPNPVNGLPVFRVNNPPNPSLRWENVAMFNIGTDFAMINHRLSGSIEYYTKKSTDLLSSMSSDITTGYEYLTINSATLAGRGVDISLSSINLKGKLKWTTNWLFSYNTNKVQRYLLDRYPKDYLSSDITPLEGEIAYAVISYRSGGLDSTGSPQGYLDGKISTDYRSISRSLNPSDFVIHGSSRPLFFGAVRNTFHWKSLSLSFNIQYRLAYYFRRTNVISYSNLFSSWEQAGYSEYVARWQKQGDEHITQVPSMVYPADPRRDNFYKQSSATVERGDHFRLQDIHLEYLWRPNKKYFFSSVRFYSYINNIGIIWKATDSKLDPDYGTPRPTSMALGINLEL